MENKVFFGNKRLLIYDDKEIHYIEAYINEIDIIKLDEILMKRIAKYNKEKEIERLEEEIEAKQDKIKKLDDILLDRNKRVEKLKKYIAEIYDIDLDDDEDYEDYDY